MRVHILKNNFSFIFIQDKYTIFTQYTIILKLLEF